jgi:uncharacterized protein (TIGR02145 family)
MAENLNYKPNDSLNSWCYNDNDSNCEKYGRLYDWYAAVKVCPEEWHLPDSNEWSYLFSIDKLKSKRGWNNYRDGKSGNGTDYFGFSALPGGVRTYSGKFLSAGDDGHWWMATETNQHSAYRFSIGLNYGEYVAKNSFAKYDGYSIRCVKEDDITGITFRVGTSRISVTKTKTGAFAKYEPGNSDLIVVELSEEEWQNFIRALYRCCIGKWEKENKDEEETAEVILRMQLIIFYSDRISKELEGYGKEYPSNFRSLEKTMNDLKAKIMEKSDTAKYKPLPSQILWNKNH